METLRYLQDTKLNAETTPVLFLAGPTPRTNILQRMVPASWRPEALRLLAEYGFEGIAVVPEFEGSSPVTPVAVDLWAWEQKWMDAAHVVLFWVPRNAAAGMPGLTTNIEFGHAACERPGAMVFGAPEGAEDVGYMLWRCRELGIPRAATLGATVHKAMMLLATFQPLAAGVDFAVNNADCDGGNHP